jgi:hypothetical protein
MAYMSRSLIEGSDQVVEWELESILDAALRNNPREGLTGALLYSGGYFCQILEGPKDAIVRLYEKIQLDERHTDVTTLNFEQVSERQFPIWAMGFAGIEHQPRYKVIGMKQDTDRIHAKETGREMLNDLVKMVAKRELLGGAPGPTGRKLPSH